MTSRWFLLSALLLAACGGPKYDVFTCAFGATEVSCTPLRASESAKDVIDMHFTLVNPNISTQGCAGEFHLGVNQPKGGYLSWHAQEQDTTCAALGQEMTGEQRLDGTEKSVDAYFPQNDFTFRVVVRPAVE